ncbi:hypothetical protein DPEC_G00297190 [Dallia pectoralis]|uniref:Uncharacterized protein n=1 Tax=Dallia pectoralis TaxID=75939 RepID=A0ACC2FFT9_DALPE|nr:hypothetical protein DPEC_G00297190 [Dallia pectoralis]
MRRIHSLIAMVLMCSLFLFIYYSSLSQPQAQFHRPLTGVSANTISAGHSDFVKNGEKYSIKNDGKMDVLTHVPGSIPGVPQEGFALSASFRESIPQNPAYWNRLLHFQLKQMDNKQSPAGPEGRNWSNCENSAEQLRTNIHDFSQYPELHKIFIRGMDCRDPPILIDQPEKCRSNGGKTFLLFAIKSTPRNFEQRQTVRETWGREAVYSGWVKVRTVFLLGTTTQDDPNLSRLLAFEGRLYGDLLQWNFQDSFFNLTLKEHAFYRWALARCPNVSFIFKGDDDVFANTKAILAYLQSLEPDKASKLYLGQALISASPLRDSKSKYYIPESFYEGGYPAYTGGGGYLFSGSLIGQLYGVTVLLPFFPIDDVYTGMCFSALGIVPEKHDGFQTFDIREQDRANVCVHRNLLLVHKRSPREIMQLWRDIKNPLLLC